MALPRLGMCGVIFGVLLAMWGLKTAWSFQEIDMTRGDRVPLLKFLFISELPVRKAKANTLRIDLLAMLMGYPGYFRKLELSDRRQLSVELRGGARIPYDDRVVKGYEEKLNNPDLQDMLAQPYVPGRIRESVLLNQDPGRIRVASFFGSVYGETADEVRKNLVTVSFCGKRVMFNAQNRAAKELESIGGELAVLLKKKPHLRKFVFPLGGTFNPRNIAGTERPSAHSYGIAIDLNPKQGAYWRWSKLSHYPLKLATRYPYDIVEIFEKHGFIWGGKWYHYDLMHFEYRPELLLKNTIKRHGTFARTTYPTNQQ
jgi:hypothetical protein